MYIQESLKTENSMEMENWIYNKKVYIQVNLLMEKEMDKGLRYGMMVVNTKVILKTIWKMVMVSTDYQMVQNILEILKMINSKEKALSNG